MTEADTNLEFVDVVGALSLQDPGRPSARVCGVAKGGWLDEECARAANSHAGNRSNSPVIEGLGISLLRVRADRQLELSMMVSTRDGRSSTGLTLEPNVVTDVVVPPVVPPSGGPELAYMTVAGELLPGQADLWMDSVSYDTLFGKGAGPLSAGRSLLVRPRASGPASSDRTLAKGSLTCPVNQPLDLYLRDTIRANTRLARCTVVSGVNRIRAKLLVNDRRAIRLFERLEEASSRTIGAARARYFPMAPGVATYDRERHTLTIYLADHPLVGEEIPIARVDLSAIPVLACGFALGEDLCLSLVSASEAESNHRERR